MTFFRDRTKGDSQHVLTSSMFKQFSAMYLTLIVLFVFWAKLLNPYLHNFFIKDIYQDKIHDHETIMIMLKNIYANNDLNEFKHLISRINKTSNVPIKVIPIKYLRLPEKSMALLADNKPTMPFYPADIHFEMLTPELVAKIGPVGVKKQADFAYAVINYSPLALFGAFTLIWVLALQYRLLRLERSVTSYSLGHFDNRATTGFWKLGNLNVAFNQMADRLTRLFTSQKQLTNAVSHELRSPISRLRFQLEMLEEASDESAKQGYIIGMSEDLDDMDDLIHELLNYATLESQESIKQREEVDICQWLKEQQQHLYAEITHEIILEPLPESLRVFIDPTSMARLLRNLVDNADKYTKNIISIGVEMTDRECVMWVDDNGDGIAGEHISQLFEPFSRLDCSRNKSTGGYGLGLAIVAQIARLHHGKVTVDKNKLGGARFIVSWPTDIGET